jgi:hypothetical protein
LRLTRKLIAPGSPAPRPGLRPAAIALTFINGAHLGEKMRPIAGIAFASLTAVSIAATTAVSVSGAGSDGLTESSLLKSADFAAFSGGSASNRVPDDPDAPIRTSRFAEPVSQIELAGGPMTETQAVAGIAEDVVQIAAATETMPNEPVVTLARVIPGGAPTGAATARVASLPGSASAAVSSSDRAFGLFSSRSRVSLSLSTNESPFNPGSGLAFGSATAQPNRAAPDIQPRSRDQESRRLGLQVDVSPETSRKGRWFVFAASSGDAFGFNLFGDPAKSGRKHTSWSVEKLAEYGKLQLGLGWRKGPMQVSAVASQRELGAFGYQKEDTVFGLSFSISGGKRLPAPKARRGMPRD